jgi:hypothetical protein
LLVSLISIDALLVFHARALRGNSCGSNQLCSLNLCGSGTTRHAEFPSSAHGRKESSCILSSPGSLDHPDVCCCLSYTSFSPCPWQAAAPLIPAQALITVRQPPALRETRLRSQLSRQPQPALHPRQLPRQHRAEHLQRRPRPPHLSRSR